MDTQSTPHFQLDAADRLSLHTEREWEDNTGNEGCGYDSARGSTVEHDRPGRGIGAELSDAVTHGASKLFTRVKHTILHYRGFV